MFLNAQYEYGLSKIDPSNRIIKLLIEACQSDSCSKKSILQSSIELIFEKQIEFLAPKFLGFAKVCIH